MNAPEPRLTPCGALPWLAKANALGLCAGAAALAALMWPLWRHDDNLAHGIFLPALSGILVVESRRDPRARFLRPGAAPLIGCACLVGLCLACLAAAAAYAAALGWTYVMAEFMLAVALVLALLAGWLAFADRRVRFMPLNWPAAVAAGLWIFASLPPPGTFARLTLLLQSQVTADVVRALNAVGIAAYREGNVIELARTSVGVSEACSGVRSLISCTVAGLFLSALLVRRGQHRAFVVALSPALAVAMNFLRSLLLTLLANSGVDIGGRWHDLTGEGILAATTLLLAGAALWLGRREVAPQARPAEGGPAAAGRSPLQVAVAAGLILAGGAACLLVAAGRGSSEVTGSAPHLAALLPAPPPGWSAQSTPDLDIYSGVLHTRALVERVYAAGSKPGDARLTLYVAYWRPGEAPVSLVDAHTPDACWPGTGWEARPVPRDRVALEVAGRTLPPADCRLFARGALETHVWFWHLYGGRPLAIVDPYSALRLLKLAWRYGFNPPKDQMFVRVSSNRPWEEVASLPTLRQFVANLKPLGL